MSVAPIDMSLRLWSDEIALAPILGRLGASDVVHVRGKPVPPSKSALLRVAPRHYASIARERAWQSSDVESWMHQLLMKIRENRSLASLVETRQIEGTFWVAILGARALPMPKIGRYLVEDATLLGLSIFLENYTELEDGNPSHRWLPERPAFAAHARSMRT